MSYRNKNRFRPLIDVVASQKLKDGDWKTDETARKDAVKVLEAIVAELGVVGCLAAIEKQGFNADSYKYIVEPLHEESVRRRSLYQSSTIK